MLGPQKVDMDKAYVSTKRFGSSTAVCFLHLSSKTQGYMKIRNITPSFLRAQLEMMYGSS